MLPGYNLNNNEIHLLIHWINSALKGAATCTDLEQLRDGVIYCKLLVTLHPGALSKDLVIEQCRNASDFMHNYLLLRAGFDNARIRWNFEVKDLIDGRMNEMVRLAKFFVYLFGMQQKAADAASMLPTPLPPRDNEARKPESKLPKLYHVLDHSFPLPQPVLMCDVPRMAQPAPTGNRRTFTHTFHTDHSVSVNAVCDCAHRQHWSYTPPTGTHFKQQQQQQSKMGPNGQQGREKQ
ncbi:microtubule-associated protein RP/EB family member 2-like [Scaptodrosophila lebanonensis]|uniref:Microtubule-associated protein RP/EB family member 2-like n=1 Tax=Drosophila lebanonensis TaxID=7225 RepID=A0A6J2TUL8_DROLE|nr:microtubule-associated protein RP/EB family member 2-like [Scaptodrosophila lebanonensis]